MSFDARAFVTEKLGDYQPYEFIGLDGKKHQLPNVNTLTFRQITRLEQDLKAVIEEIAPDAYETLADLPVFAWQELGEKWNAHGEEAGKSPRPSPSRATRRNGARSKRT